MDTLRLLGMDTLPLLDRQRSGGGRASNRTLVAVHHKSGMSVTMCALLNAFLLGELRPFLLRPCPNLDYEEYWNNMLPDLITPSSKAVPMASEWAPLLQCRDSSAVCMDMDDASLDSTCTNASEFNQWSHFIHMVRDPVELIISDYQYVRHAPEPWTNLIPSSQAGADFFDKCPQFNYFPNSSEAHGDGRSRMSAVDFLRTVPVDVGLRAVSRHALRTQIRSMHSCKAQAEASGRVAYSELRLEDTSSDFIAFVRQLYGKLGIPTTDVILRGAIMLNNAVAVASEHKSDRSEKARLREMLRVDEEICPQLQAAQRALGYPAILCDPGGATARRDEKGQPVAVVKHACEADMKKWLFALCVEDSNCPLELLMQDRRRRRFLSVGAPVQHLFQEGEGSPIERLFQTVIRSEAEQMISGRTADKEADLHRMASSYLNMARATGLRFRHGGGGTGAGSSHWLPLSSWGDPAACAQLIGSRFCVVQMAWYTYGFCIPASCNATDAAAELGHLLEALASSHGLNQSAPIHLSHDGLICQENELDAQGHGGVDLRGLASCAVLILLAVPWLLRLSAHRPPHASAPADRIRSSSEDRPLIVLNGLRVILISTVVLAHLTLHDIRCVRPGDDFEAMARYMSSGELLLTVASALCAIQGCFFMSAFLSWLKLTRAAGECRPSMGALAGTIVLRALRFWPALLTMLALFPFVLAPWAARHSLERGRLATAQSVIEMTNQCDAAGLLRTMLFLPNFGLEFGNTLDRWCLPHTWFLAVDLQAYVWVLLVAKVVGTRVGPRSMAAYLAAIALTGTLLVVYLATHFQLHEMFTTFDMIRSPGVLVGIVVGPSNGNRISMDKMSPATYAMHEAFDHSVLTTAAWPVAMGIVAAEGVSGTLGHAGKRLLGLDDGPTARLHATCFLWLALFLLAWPLVVLINCGAGTDEWRQFLNTADMLAFRERHERIHPWNLLSHAGYSLGYPSMGIGFALLVVLSHLDAPAFGMMTIKRFLGHGLFCVLAPWTFMVYMVHEPLYQVYLAVATADLRPYDSWPDMLGRLGFLAFVFLLAGALHAVVEQPWHRHVVAPLEAIGRARLGRWNVVRVCSMKDEELRVFDDCALAGTEQDALAVKGSIAEPGTTYA